MAKRKPKAKMKTAQPKARRGPKPNRRLDDPQALRRPLTPRRLATEVTSAANLAYGGQETAIQGERNVHAQVQRDLPAWFQSYENVAAMAALRNQQANAAAVAAQQQAAASTSALDAQQRATLTADMQRDASMRGATVDPMVDATAQQAATARRSTQDAFTGLTAGLGAVQTAYDTNRQVVAAGQRVSARREEANRGLAIERQARELQRDKGLFKVKTRRELVDREHTKDLERKAFGLTVEKARAEQQARLATIEDRRRARITANRNADQARALRERSVRVQEERERREANKDAEQRRRKLGPYAPRGSKQANQKDAYGNTLKQRQAAQDRLDRALLLSGPLRVPEGTTVDTLAALLANKGVSALDARAAAEIKINGRVSPATAEKLKRRGARAPRRR